LRRWDTAPTPVTGNEHALFGFERAPVSRSPISAEPHGPDVWYHCRAARIRSCAAASRGLKHWTVDESAAQFSDACLPPLLALLLERANLSTPMAGGGRRGVGGRLNGEPLHQQRAEIVGASYAPSPPGRCRIQQKTVQHAGRGRKRANEGFHRVEGRQIDGTRDRVFRRRRGNDGPCVMGEAFRDLDISLAFGTARVLCAPSLTEGLTSRPVLGRLHG